MARSTTVYLSRRESQIMDIVYARGQASVGDVLGDLPDPPSYSAVRALMRILEDKGHLKHKKQGIKYLYSPARTRQAAARSALRRALHTFFNGSVEAAVVTLLDVSDTKLSRQQIDQLSKLVRKAGRG